MSAHSLHMTRRPRKSDVSLGRPRRAWVTVVLDEDVFDLFVTQVEAARPQRVEVVSPWVGDGVELARLTPLINHLSRCNAGLTLTTRPEGSPAHEAFISGVRAYQRGRVVMSPELHAKMYICEANGRGSFAIVGSANASEGSRLLLESAVLLRPVGRSGVIRDISRFAASLGDTGVRRRGTPV